jgi:hypothetical protein
MKVGKATATMVPSIEDIRIERAAKPKKIQRRSSVRARKKGMRQLLLTAEGVVVAHPAGEALTMPH